MPIQTADECVVGLQLTSLLGIGVDFLPAALALCERGAARAYREPATLAVVPLLETPCRKTHTVQTRETLQARALFGILDCFHSRFIGRTHG